MNCLDTITIKAKSVEHIGDTEVAMFDRRGDRTSFAVTGSKNALGLLGVSGKRRISIEGPSEVHTAFVSALKKARHASVIK